MKTLYFLSIIIKISFIIFLTIPILLISKSYASTEFCDFKKAKYIRDLNNKKKIIQINIKTNNLRKLTKTNLEILKSDGSLINQKLKKYYKSTVEVQYNFGTCKYPAKIRQTGDKKDHIILSKGKINQSLKIKLIEGNILGNVNFKLLIPQTRGDDEILVTQLLKSLNILSPEIFYVRVNNNGHKSKMLFHQEANKEFLEQNLKLEGPIFEGDESLIWNFNNTINPNYLENFSLARMVNAKWTEKNANAKYISSKAYSKIQKIYLNKINKKNIFYLDHHLLSNHKKSFREKWETFEFIMLSANCSHGLNGINRKFYWDALNQAFLPIFYDGECKIDNKYLRRLIKKKFLNTTDIGSYKEIFIKEKINKIKKKLLNLDLNDFNNKFSNSDKLNKSKIKKKIDTIIENLNELEVYINNKNNSEFFHNNINNFQISKLEKVFNNKLPNYFFLDLDANDILELEDSKFFICRNKKCFYKKFSIKEIFSMSKNKNNIKYIFNNFKENEEKIIEEKIFINGNQIFIKRTNGIQIQLNNENIYIKQNFVDDWVTLHNSTLKNINIYYIGTQQEKKQIARFNKNGLTGCLNFIEINFETNVSIDYKNSNCEDSVNIRNSYGNIKNLYVKNSFSDALDIDFSNISIENVYVHKAKNDCIDFSFGKYKIKNAYLDYCTDKSVSLGERSSLEIEKSSIFNSNTALVAKDSSILNVKYVNFQNVEICASAYNKKQEFDGAIIFLNNNSCKKENSNHDYSSKIIF